MLAARKVIAVLAIVCTSYFQALPSHADPGPDDSEGRASLFGSDEDRGVIAITSVGYGTPSQDGDTVNVADASSGSIPVGNAANWSPLNIGLSAPNCSPYGSSGGIGLSDGRGPVVTSNCLSLPDAQLGNNNSGRNRRGPSLADLVGAASDKMIALAIRPDLRIAPGEIGLTGLPSYFWLAVSPQPITATASAGGTTVTAQAFPVQFHWVFDDGEDLITQSSGRPWTKELPGNIEHTYEARGQYNITVEVLYQARWQVNGGPWQSLGYFTTSGSRDYPVRQVVAVLVKP
jgi:hypothetical protein